jgi:hypothetical protein
LKKTSTTSPLLPWMVPGKDMLQLPICEWMNLELWLFASYRSPSHPTHLGRQDSDHILLHPLLADWIMMLGLLLRLTTTITLMMTMKNITSIVATVDICDISRSLASLAPPSSSKSFVQTPNDEKPAAAKQMWNVAGNRARLAHVPIPGSQRPSFHPL